MAEEIKLLTLPQVAKIAGIEYRTAHVWMQRGLLRASVCDAAGSGHRAEFSWADAVRARILAELRQLVGMPTLARAATALAEQEIALANPLRVTLLEDGPLTITVFTGDAITHVRAQLEALG